MCYNSLVSNVSCRGKVQIIVRMISIIPSRASDHSSRGSANSKPRQGNNLPQRCLNLALPEGKAEQYRVAGHHCGENMAESRIAYRVYTACRPREHEEHGIPS